MKITLSEDEKELLNNRIKDLEFNSRGEYIEFIISNIIIELENIDGMDNSAHDSEYKKERDGNDMEERLKDLGYIS